MSRRDRDPRDNSYGLGYYEPPAKIRNLGRFADNLDPKRVLKVKVFPREGIWMVTTRSDLRFSILERDLESLMRLGLVRIQVNDPGEISLYFKDKPLTTPSRDRRRTRRP
jgi:hypothetical protein